MTTAETPYVPGLSPNTVSALLRFLSASGSFDPNEDPVLIGLGASIDDGGGNTATPDDPNTYFAGTTVIGGYGGAFADGAGQQTAVGGLAICRGPGTGGVAVGVESEADDEYATAIGSNATARWHDVAVGGQANAVNNGSDGALAVGYDAQAAGDGAVAVGNQAVAADDGAVAVGDDAAAADYAVALGAGANTHSGGTALGAFAKALNSEDGTAVGYGATVHGGADRATAIGAGAEIDDSGSDATALGHDASNGGFSSCTAIGHDAVNTAFGQVMLGSNGEYAETDLGYAVTDTDGSGNRWIIQVTAGVITLNAAP